MQKLGWAGKKIRTNDGRWTRLMQEWIPKNEKRHVGRLDYQKDRTTPCGKRYQLTMENNSTPPGLSSHLVIEETRFYCVFNRVAA
uniref:Uncharacterized protein n=1 Tax=Caenorhabditis japonica TaxID=281687 RepID=A0A8R1EDV6_CAEJA